MSLDTEEMTETEAPGAPAGHAPWARRWNEPPVLLALGAILAGVLALGMLLVPRPPASDSAEAGFARDMIVHHEQAVRMAELITGTTRDTSLKAISTDIVYVQQFQMGQLWGWLESWKVPRIVDTPAMTWMGMPVEDRMPGMASPEEIGKLQTARGDARDEQFMRLMVPHHQAGVAMAEAVLARTDRSEVRKLAEQLAAAQTFEIDAMQDLLEAKGLAPVAMNAGTADHATGHEHGGAGGSSTGSGWPGPARTAPLLLAVAALAWLLADAVVRRRRWRA
jgi:uncharacterized protein (DUF305 family)